MTDFNGSTTYDDVMFCTRTGVQLFMGKFYRCVDEDDNKLTTDIVKNRQECDEQGYRWRNAKVNFDNVASGYLALLQIVSYRALYFAITFCNHIF